MKHAMNGNGADSTQALLSYLLTRGPLWTAELYQIRAPRSAGTPFAAPLLLCDWSSALIWSVLGKFQKAVIQHSGIETTIGLEAQEVTLDWSVNGQTLLYASDGTTPLEDYYSAFREGLFDHSQVRIWRAYMPTPGDANSLGVVLQFAGRIGDSTTDSLGVHLSVTSALEVLNRKIPPNLIENANINAAWLLSTNPVTMVAQPGSSPQQLFCKVQGDPTRTFEPGVFRYGHVYFPPPAGAGELAGRYRQIQDSFVTNGVNVLQLFEPLPFPPNVNVNLGLTTGGEVFQAYFPHPQTLAANDPSQPGYPQYMGFQFVPRPEDTI